MILKRSQCLCGLPTQTISCRVVTLTEYILCRVSRSPPWQESIVGKSRPLVIPGTLDIRKRRQNVEVPGLDGNKNAKIWPFALTWPTKSSYLPLFGQQKRATSSVHSRIQADIYGKVCQPLARVRASGGRCGHLSGQCSWYRST
jgi:hypothetical protein